EAVRWCCQADVSGPRDPSRWGWMQCLGRALMQLGRDAEAVEALRQALESNPGWARGHALLAAALLLSGDAAGARRHYAEFLERAGDAEAETPARLVSVPEEAVSQTYRDRNRRVVEALHRLSAASRG
ncbi:MAG TPA: tetratricopeptide repeat protein, partial [Crenalkalicoccus sp.]|nr:tetratricopeptide repeat protein [Crenalkalicoccus sp.]